MKTTKNTRMTLTQRLLNFVAATGCLAACLTASAQAAGIVGFKQRFHSAAENSGGITLEVTRTGELTGVATVNWETVPFTAAAGTDYQAGSGQVAFQPGESSKTISVVLLDDPAQEGAESFTIQLSNLVGADYGSFTNAEVTIEDNEKPFLVDTSFDPGAGGDGNPDRVLPLPDGKLLIIGFFSQYQGFARKGIARLNADGSLDETYEAALAGDFVYVSRWSRAPDGKLVIHGSFSEAAGQPRKNLARLNADGTLDATFDPGNWYSSGVISTINAQPDGKVIVSGFFTELHGQPRKHIARLNADGSLDDTFNAGEGPDTSVVDAVLQNDGKIVVCGSFTNFAGVARSRVARLNPNGSLDMDWSPLTDGTRVFSFVPFLIRRLALRADGKLFIQGDGLQTVNGQPRRGFALLNEDGTLDPAFVPGNLSSMAVNWFTALPNGGLLAAAAWISTAANADYAFVRLGPDGSFDLAFDPDIRFNGNDAQVTADGNYLVTGFFNQIGGVRRPGLARLFADGTGRQGFNFVSSGASASEGAGQVSVTVQRRGESSGAVSVNVPLTAGTATAGADYLPGAGAITFGPLETHKSVVVPLVGDSTPEADEHFTAALSSAAPGVFYGLSSAALWILDDDRAGSVDASFQFSAAGLTFFGSSGEAMAQPSITDVTALTPLPGGQILAAVFASDNAFPFDFGGAVARFNPDGSPDLSFPTYPVVNFTGPSQITPMNGGRRFLVNRGDSLVRLLGNGAMDPGFNVAISPADGFDYAYISDVVVQPDQKVLIAGLFGFVNGVPRKNIARLTVTGAVDPTFDPGAGPDDTVIDIALQPDGRVVLGGWFLNVGGEPRLFFARLNPNGTLDPSLDPGDSFTDPFGGYPTIQSVNVQRDGRILVGGFFDTYQGASQFSLVRLMPNGARDASFDIGAGFGEAYDPSFPGFVTGVTLQPDGKVLVTGNYGQFDGIRATGVVRLNANGSLDTSFQLTGTALLDPFSSAYIGSPAALLRDGDLLVPLFTGNEWFSLNGIVRLNGDLREQRNSN
jgi:uncharacterized delta-60 repeat protein